MIYELVRFFKLLDQASLENHLVGVGLTMCLFKLEGLSGIFYR